MDKITWRDILEIITYSILAIVLLVFIIAMAVTIYNYLFVSAFGR